MPSEQSGYDPNEIPTLPNASNEGQAQDEALEEKSDAKLRGSELSPKERSAIQLEILNSLKTMVASKLEGMKKLRLRAGEGGDGVAENSYDLRSGKEEFVRIYEQPTLDKAFEINIYIAPEFMTDFETTVTSEITRVQDKFGITIKHTISPLEYDDFNPLNL